jgi:hypothetical protein
VSTGKKVFVPNFSFIGLDATAESAPCGASLEPVISSFDFGSVSLEAIRSVTHLGLALNATSLFIKKLPLLSAHPAFAGPENVQCRSVFIQLIRALVPPAPFIQAPAANPFLTHGTVESPAKVFLEQFHCIVK